LPTKAEEEEDDSEELDSKRPEKPNEDGELYGPEGKIESWQRKKATLPSEDSLRDTRRDDPISSEDHPQSEESGDKTARVDLVFYRDAEYIGDIYLGAPHSQRATVVIDTGSSWLNVKACIDPKHCHKHEFEKPNFKGKPPKP